MRCDSIHLRRTLRRCRTNNIHTVRRCRGGSCTAVPDRRVGFKHSLWVPPAQPEPVRVAIARKDLEDIIVDRGPVDSALKDKDRNRHGMIDRVNANIRWTTFAPIDDTPVVVSRLVAVSVSQETDMGHVMVRGAVRNREGGKGVLLVKPVGRDTVRWRRGG